MADLTPEEESRLRLDPTYIEGVGTIAFANYTGSEFARYSSARYLGDAPEPCIVCGVPYGACTHRG